MSLGTFLIMRHELLLIAAALLVLIAEIFRNPDNKRSISLFSIILFGIITIAGFLPSPAGSLFGGMYVTYRYHASDEEYSEHWRITGFYSVCYMA